MRITLAAQPSRRLWLFLAERAERHSGHECPSDLLNGGDDFVPARDAEGRVFIFQRSAVMVVTVAADEETAAEGSAQSEQVTTVAVDLSLQDGTRLRGELTYWRPEGQRRVQDFLNTADRFIPVREGEVIHLVNRDKIVSLSQS